MPPVALEYSTPLHPFLQPGERVVWFGQPPRGWRVPPRLTAIAVALCVALIWIAWRLFTGEVTLLAMIHHPIRLETVVIVGAIWAVYVCWADAQFRRNAWYGVTNRRVVLLWGNAADRVRAHQTCFDLADLPPLEWEQYGDGTGTIRFLLSPAAKTEQRAWGEPPAMGEEIARSLYRIPGAAEVERLLRDSHRREAQEAASTPPHAGAERSAAPAPDVLTISAIPAPIPIPASQIDATPIHAYLDENEHVFWLAQPPPASHVDRTLVNPSPGQGVWYAITDRRVLIVSGTRTRRVVSYALHRLPKLDVARAESGRGSIRFILPGASDGKDAPSKRRPKRDLARELEDVGDVVEVVQLLNALRAAMSWR